MKFDIQGIEIINGREYGALVLIKDAVDQYLTAQFQGKEAKHDAEIQIRAAYMTYLLSKGEETK